MNKLILILFLFLLIVFINNRDTFSNSLDKEEILNKLNKFVYYNQDNKKITPSKNEIDEQRDIIKYIEQDDIVLQLGGKYSSISNTIAYKQNNSGNLVVVESDKSILEILKSNKERNGSNFIILDKNIISNNDKDLNLDNYSTKRVNKESFSQEESRINYDDFKVKYPLNFNVLIADCEGCLCDFIETIGDDLNNYNKILFVANQNHMCFYNKLLDKFQKNGFEIVKNTDNFRYVLIKNKKESNKSFFGKSNICTPIKVDKCFVLTLGTNTERYKNFINSYNKLKLNIPIEEIIGINTKIPKNAEPYKHMVEKDRYDNMYEYDKNIKPRPNHTYFNSGALGCYLGHMEFYKKSFKQNLKYSIIFEDNVVFNADFNKELNSCLKSLPDDFDVCFLHNHVFIGNEEIICDQPITEVKWLLGTKSYLINVNNMKKYYNLFYPIDNHVDRVYEKLISNGCKVYYKKFKSINLLKTPSLINHTGIESNKNFFYSNLNERDIKTGINFSGF
jgi:GR25 family glycosyltransferase involved in LPS biosynthesis